MSEFVFSFTIIVTGTCTSKQVQLTVVHLAVCILTEMREINFTFKFFNQKLEEYVVCTIAILPPVSLET